MVKKTGQPRVVIIRKSPPILLIALENTTFAWFRRKTARGAGLDSKNSEKHVRRETYKKGVRWKSSGTSDGKALSVQKTLFCR
jgi:hypothetical protein